MQFGVRGDEVVTRAPAPELRLFARAAAQISHLRVLVNERVVATIPRAQRAGGQALQKVIDIPTRLIGEFNRLNVELIGHYTMDCEDPAHQPVGQRGQRQPPGAVGGPAGAGQ